MLVQLHKPPIGYEHLPDELYLQAQSESDSKLLEKMRGYELQGMGRDWPELRMSHVRIALTKRKESP